MHCKHIAGNFTFQFLQISNTPKTTHAATPDCSLSSSPFSPISRRLTAIADLRLRFAIGASLILLMLFLVHGGRMFLPTPLGSGEQDYAAFYGAARAALGGVGGNLYDPAVFQQAIGAQTTLLWLYPPPMLFFLAPFGVLSFGAAKVLWALLSVAAAFSIGRMITQSNAIGAISVISPASFATLLVGQVSAFFGLLLIAGLLLAKKRPVVAGACIAVLTIKAQYGLLVIPFLIAMRAWKALVAASAFTIVLIVASALVFGPEMWRAFFDSLMNGVHAAYYQSGGHAGRITLSDAIKALGLAAPSALVIYPPLIIAATAGLFMIARKASFPLVVAYTLAASAVICPYLFVYDFFMVQAAILLVGIHVTTLRTGEAILLGALWFAPVAPFVIGSAITPALLWPLSVAALGAIFLIAQRDSALASA